MTGHVFRTVLSHWWRNPLQLCTLLMGLSLATALWSGVQAINAEARASYDAAAATLGEGQFAQLRRKDGAPMTEATFVSLRRAGWLVSPVVEGRINGVRLVGLDPVTAPGGLGPVPLDGGADAGRFFSGVGQVYATEDAMDAVATETDAELLLAPETAANTVITDVRIAQDLLDKQGQIDRLILSPETPLGRAELEAVAPDLSIIAVQDNTDVGQLTASFHLNLTAFGFLSFAVGIFIVNGAIGLAFEQRRGMVRTMRAVGVPLHQLMLVMALELLVFGLIAGAIGVVLGYIIATLLLPDVAATLRGLYGADVSGSLQLRPVWWLSGLAISVGGVVVAAIGAFWTLSKMPLLSGAHQRAMAMAAQRRSVWQGGLAICLLALAAVLAVTADGLASGFVMLGALLVGAALALPLLLDRSLAFGQARAAGPIAQWFWADTRQQLPGLSLALMALLLAIAANVGVSTMVSSFRTTFVDFLDQRLASELYLTTEDGAQAEEVIAFVTPRVDAILPIQSVDRTVLGLPTEVFGARNHGTTRDNWQFLSAIDAPWDAVHKGDGVLINEQLARRTETAVGDVATIKGRAFPVVGIYGDYGNPIGQAILKEEVFKDLFQPPPATEFGLRLPAKEVAQLVADMETELGLSPNRTINQAAIKELSLGIFERTFSVTAALNILTLAVAGFAILMSLLTLATMRLPQLAPAWALGLTRAELGRYELIRALVLAALTFIVALPLGLALAWILLAVVNVAAFGWKLPMFFFPVDYLSLGALALIAAVTAAFWPAVKLSRTPPAELLKVFAHER
ncbi:ABC transporter permease [Cognatiyoonia sp.]|uniref:ABC transporter permease n=1 Tax=Cognatiyoonia sp. TaxID=2211652 RepID=UPI003F69B3AE